MTKEQALEYIHDNPQIYLQTANKEGYVCPICGSGSGPNGTGIVSRDGVHFTCFARKCFERNGKGSADIPDIIAIKEGLEPGSRQALNRAYELYGITIDSPLSTGEKLPPDPGKAPPVKAAGKRPEQDYSAYIDECHARIGQTTYPQQDRWLTGVTIDRFKLGYDPAFKTREGDNYVQWQALVIPNGPYRLTVRNLAPDARKENRYRFRGANRPFNDQALQQTAEPVFVVEGEIDALSVIEAGGEAVAIATDVQLLLRSLGKNPPMLILALDKDDAGQEAEAKLVEELSKRGIPFLQADLTGGYKDANEALVKGQLAFLMAVNAAKNSVLALKKQTLSQEQAAYLAINAEANIDGLFAAIKKGKKAYPTGFSMLDNHLRGGLFEGLTIIGAMTSVGKTTLTMQIADNMAMLGNDVLIFSLEMGIHELMARSISKGTLMQSFFRKAGDYSQAMTARQILSGEPGQPGILEEATRAYREYAGRINIFQSLGKIGPKRIREEVEGYKAATGSIPVVVIDYLQLLGQDEGKYSAGAKEIMDAAVTELKCMAVDLEIPVILISSFNRDNYGKDANLASFKESGGIEYSADLLLGLQYAGTGKDGRNQDNLEKIETMAQENPRKMELKIMKYRNGEWGQRILMDYYAPFNFFKETGTKTKAVRERGI